MENRNSEIQQIHGGIAKDDRGQIRFVNEFDMAEIKRFYLIKNANDEIVRGWRAHKIEKRWFYVISGAFEIKIAMIDDWLNPSPNLPIITFNISESDQKILCVPEGYGTAIRALEGTSELLVFANFGIENAPKDDYLWPINYFEGNSN